MPWKGGLVGINSFGFGGSNVHVILQSPEAPEPEILEKPALPTVVPASGRTEEGVKKMLQFARENNESKGLLSLLMEISSRPLNAFTHRGYAIIGSENAIEDVVKVQSNTRPIWYVFSGMGTQWPGMGEKLMQIPTFRESISKTAEILKEFEVDLVKIIMESDSNTYNSTINSFVGLASIQIALVDCLKALGKFVCFLKLLSLSFCAQCFRAVLMLCMFQELHLATRRIKKSVSRSKFLCSTLTIVGLKNATSVE